MYGLCWAILGVLGGSWELVTTYTWAYNQTYSPLTGVIELSPFISQLQVVSKSHDEPARYCIKGQ